MAGILAFLPLAAHGQAIRPVVEVEDSVYTYKPADKRRGADVVLRLDLHRPGR